MKKKSKRILIKLTSSHKTGFFYITNKNKKTKKKISVKKYDPKIRKHVLFNEDKIKK